MARPLLLVALAAAAILTADPLRGEAASYALEESAQETRVFDVSSTVNVTGKLQTPGTGGTAQALDLSLKANFRHQERRLPGSGRDAEALRSVREYEQALVEIDVESHHVSTRLRDNLRTVVAQGRSDGVELYSRGGNFTYQELELLSVPGDCLAVLALLPEREVEVGESWTPRQWSMQTLTRLEAVVKEELSCTLASVENQRAVIEFKGSIEGADVGAATKVSVEGKLTYDLDQHCLVAGEIKQTEKRSVGAVSPGLDVVAEARFDRRPTRAPTRLTDALVESIPLDTPAESLLLTFESPWKIRFLYDRDWHVFQQTEKVAFLRMLDKGSLIAQCNISPIPNAPPGQHTSEQEFQNDISRSLGDRFQGIEKAEQLTTTDGRFIYRVTAHGEANNAKMTWLYYLCAAPSGRQVALVFAVQTDLLERLGNSDLGIVRGLEIGAAP